MFLLVPEYGSFLWWTSQFFSYPDIHVHHGCFFVSCSAVFALHRPRRLLSHYLFWIILLPFAVAHKSRDDSFLLETDNRWSTKKQQKARETSIPRSTPIVKTVFPLPRFTQGHNSATKGLIHVSPSEQQTLLLPWAVVVQPNQLKSWCNRTKNQVPLSRHLIMYQDQARSRIAGGGGALPTSSSAPVGPVSSATNSKSEGGENSNKGDAGVSGSASHNDKPGLERSSLNAAQSPPDEEVHNLFRFNAATEKGRLSTVPGDV